MPFMFKWAESYKMLEISDLVSSVLACTIYFLGISCRLLNIITLMSVEDNNVLITNDCVGIIERSNKSIFFLFVNLLILHFILH